MFTPTIRAHQVANGSRGAYERLDEIDTPPQDRLGSNEIDFIAARDMMFMASVTETGWPYVQHRGGPIGFLKVLDEHRLAFADFRGNRQFVSVGNLATNRRVSLILMDLAGRRRLKIIGNAKTIDAAADPDLMTQVTDDSYRARVERAIVIDIVGFDWNCPQHITPRFTEAEIQAASAPLLARLAQVERELADMRRLAGSLAEQLGDAAALAQITDQV
jgi:predicted pyridoxine 5'-phosphate oxidase superfamily flavin-nucleotide-binding protein